MNNKKLGTAFEMETCKILNEEGWWVHFITPDVSGKQPFDIIAVKDGVPVAIDCKTCVRPVFSWSRAEENQRMAFEKFINCGGQAFFFVKHEGKIYKVPFEKIKAKGKINLPVEAEEIYGCNS